ncbi:MAG TPA: phosphoribosyltransferase family protein [Candidatus Methylacidiphilales bacterium]|jgi:ComF family protein|nr:phosphoribosyltransferase family protein [Candidatus Methylacidiphilales bacterium]
MALLSSSLRFARDWGECALNLAFPWPETTAAEPVAIERPYCRQCGYPYPGLPVDDSTFLCAHCSERTWHFEWARSGYRTEGQVLDAIIGFKYRDEYYQHVRLVQWLTKTFDDHARHGDWHALVPVPLYHRRRRERGFNQAHEMARGLAVKRKIPVLDCLYRYRETVSQTKLERTARWENMSGAFRMKRGFDVKGRYLLIIDDVFTTGATVNACAQALAQAGAARLAVLTVARS